MQPGSGASQDISVAQISRFISTLAGSFRSFYLFKHDNKVFDEIMQNLSKRFDDVAKPDEPMAFTITSRSFLYKGEPVGFREITVHFAAVLTALGFKEIVFKAPVHRTQFFQLLHILTGKDADESKHQKLTALITDDETKPIRLVPRTSALFAAQLSDDTIKGRLAPLLTPQAQGGTGFLEDMAKASLRRLPDLYSWIDRSADRLQKGTAVFVHNLTDATREGYFPIERFLTLFPLAPGLKDTLLKQIQGEGPLSRKVGPLAQRFRPAARRKAVPRAWMDRVAGYSENEVNDRYRRKSEGNPISAMGDLQLSESLLSEPGPNFLLGLRFLIRFLGEKNPVAAQDSAIKLAMSVWSKVQEGTDDARLLSLLSALRQHLISFNNVNLVLFPLREATLESTVFSNTLRYLLSLGKAVVPPLIQALDTEQDRGMRKKLCHLITSVARETGIESLLESTREASPFLLRNIMMVLGDIRNPGAISIMVPFISHQQRIVRVEALRSLAKIGTPEATAAIATALPNLNDAECAKLALTHLVEKHYTAVVPELFRMVKNDKTDSTLKKALYISAAGIGGPVARQMLEATLNGSNFLGFGGEQRDLIKSLLEKMPK